MPFSYGQNTTCTCAPYSNVTHYPDATVLSTTFNTNPVLPLYRGYVILSMNAPLFLGPELTVTANVVSAWPIVKARLVLLVPTMRPSVCRPYWMFRMPVATKRVPRGSVIRGNMSCLLE